MEREAPSVEFAPAGVIRAAAWPIESLDAFGDGELAALAVRAKRSCEHTWTQYSEAYERVLQRERQALWHLTSDDVLFVRALLLSAPHVADRVRRSTARRHVRTKSIRHLETTLYRYLARAAGRTVPNGLWAGVGVVNFAESMRYERSAPLYSFSPDLRPFQVILRSLGGRAIYRSKACWRPNPTLARQRDGAWQYWTRTGEGRMLRRQVEQHEAVDRILNAIGKLGTGTFDQIIEAAEKAPGRQTRCDKRTAPSALRPTLDALADGGVLVGGLDLPNRFTTAWDALSAAEPRLTPDDRLAWSRSIEELHCICQQLSVGLDSMTLEALQDHLQRSTESIAELARALGVSLPSLPNPSLHCDLALPFHLDLSAGQHSALVHALEDYERGWINQLSPAAAFRTVLRDLLAKRIERGIAIEELDLQGALDAMRIDSIWADLRATHHEQVVARLEEWERRVGEDQAEVVLELNGNPPVELASSAPFGCFYAGLFEGFQLAVHGIGEDPARAFARHFGLLRLRELQTWLSKRLEHLSIRHAIKIAELQASFEKNPNVLARPDFGALAVELWGANPDTVSLRGAQLVLDPVTRLPFLSLPSIPEPIAVFCFSSADIGAGDPIARQLLWTGFQDTPAPNFRASAITVSAELVTPRFTPRIRLPRGAVLRSRRTVLTGDRLKDLARVPAIQRYCEWQRLAARYNWPARLRIQRDGEPALLVHRDSPLALECVFKGVRDHIRSLIVEELPGIPWLVDANGCHYMAEIAVPFVRPVHCWCPRADAHSADGADPMCHETR